MEQVKKRKPSIWERNSVVEDTSYKRIVGEFDSPRSYLDNTEKAREF